MLTQSKYSTAAEILVADTPQSSVGAGRRLSNKGRLLSYGGTLIHANTINRNRILGAVHSLFQSFIS